MDKPTSGWTMDVSRGPNCLFVRLRELDAKEPASVHDSPEIVSLYDQLWSQVSQHFVRRLVMELEGAPPLEGELLEQLLRVRERLEELGGSLRLCGLSPESTEQLRQSGLDEQMPCYASRDDALMHSSAWRT